MIFRKPYAFLIKNFKKIHILMFALAVFIYIKLNIIVSFMSDFITFGTYNQSLEPFSSKTGILFYLALIFLIIISITLIILLKRKDKPWKIYIAYVAEFTLILLGVLFASSYFDSYTVNTAVSSSIIYRDMLRICKYLEFGVFALLGIRILGIDIKKFSFDKDEEFLELSQDDREEFEVSFDFDKNAINRKYNATKRNLKYFYKEHKFICDITLAAFTLILIGYGISYYSSHKSYKQNKTFKAGIYDITVENSYVTDKDMAGNKIEKDSKFVVVFIRLKNNSREEIIPDLNRYHLMNGNYDKTYSTYYNNYFKDIGNGADSKIKISSGKEKEFYMVYKVKENLNNKRFVLYYQELGGKLGNYLRKIKLNIKDVSKINDMGSYNIGDEIKFKYADDSIKKVTFNNYTISTEEQYSRRYCKSDKNCSINIEVVRTNNGYKLLKLAFASSDFEGTEFVDFSEKYGRIKYVDSSGKVKYAEIKDAIDMDYQGKEIFIKSKSEVLDSSKLEIVYTLRNNRYTLKLR